VSRRGGLEKLSSEQASVTKAKGQPFIQLVFSREIEFVADMTARAGTCGNSNGSTAGIEVVIRSGQPVAFECLFQLPFVRWFFSNSTRNCT
jgi:hypothetical protein